MFKVWDHERKRRESTPSDPREWRGVRKKMEAEAKGVIGLNLLILDKVVEVHFFPKAKIAKVLGFGLGFPISLTRKLTRMAIPLPKGR